MKKTVAAAVLRSKRLRARRILAVEAITKKITAVHNPL